MGHGMGRSKWEENEQEKRQEGESGERERERDFENDTIKNPTSENERWKERERRKGGMKGHGLRFTTWTVCKKEAALIAREIRRRSGKKGNDKNQTCQNEDRERKRVTRKRENKR